jgi:chromosome segregation ATPase
MIDESKDPYELSLMKDIISTTEVPDKDSLLESIKNKLSTINPEGGTTSSKLIEDLEKASLRITELEEKNAELLESLSVGTTEVSKLKDTIIKLKSANRKLNNSVIKLQNESKSIAKRLKLAESKLQIRNAQMTDTTADLTELTENHKALEKELKSVKRKLMEASNYKKEALTEAKSLKESYSKLQSANRELSRQLEESRVISNKKITALTENIKTLMNRYISTVCKHYSLSESEVISRIKDRSKVTTAEIDNIVTEMINHNDRIRSLPFDLTSGTKVDLSIVESKSTLDPELERAKKFAEAGKNRIRGY